jgi:hypothetical protein
MSSIQETLLDIDKRLRAVKLDASKLLSSDRVEAIDQIVILEDRHQKAQADFHVKQSQIQNSAAFRSVQLNQNNLDASNNIVNQLGEAIATQNDIIITGQAIQQTLDEDGKVIGDIHTNLIDIENEGITGESRAKRMLRRA